MTKTVLDFDFEYDFQLIGISCHQKDYRLAWFINQQLKWDLKKMANVEVPLPKGIKEYFSRSTYSDQAMNISYDLVTNLGAEFYLVPEHREADFFIRIDGELDNSEMQHLLSELRKIEVVNLAYNLEMNELKSKNNLCFE